MFRNSIFVGLRLKRGESRFTEDEISPLERRSWGHWARDGGGSYVLLLIAAAVSVAALRVGDVHAGGVIGGVQRVENAFLCTEAARRGER